MNAFDEIKAASDWAPHRREQVVAEALVKRALDEDWTAEQLVDAIPEGISKEAILAAAAKGLWRAGKFIGKGIDKAVWAGMKGTAKGVGKGVKAVAKPAAKPAGSLMKMWGERMRKKPISTAIGTAWVGSGLLGAGREFTRSLAPTAKRVM